MNDFLATVAARTSGAEPGLTPRRPSRFEPDAFSERRRLSRADEAVHPVWGDEPGGPVGREAGPRSADPAAEHRGPAPIEGSAGAPSRPLPTEPAAPPTAAGRTDPPRRRAPAPAPPQAVVGSSGAAPAPAVAASEPDEPGSPPRRPAPRKQRPEDRRPEERRPASTLAQAAATDVAGPGSVGSQGGGTHEAPSDPPDDLRPLRGLPTSTAAPQPPTDEPSAPRPAWREAPEPLRPSSRAGEEPSGRQGRRSGPPAAPTVLVTIGRVEVRGPVPPAREKRTPRQRPAVLPLNDYLRAHRGGA